MATIGSETAAKMTAALQRKIPIDQTQHYDLVIENDLAGRAVLAVLWTHRAKLAVHIISHDPGAKHVTSLTTALQSVRDAPEVVVISPDDAHQLATSSERLIWAVDAQRTSERVKTILQDRVSDLTLTPLLIGFEVLNGCRPDQMQPGHELILRDVICEHARFLNFFGDRFNPQDLYERSKYPDWFTPPHGFDAALPQLWSQLMGADGTVLHRGKFSGTLHFEANEMLKGNRLVVELGSLGEIFQAGSELTVSLDTRLCVHGGLQLQEHCDQKRIQAINIVPGQSLPEIRFSAVRPGRSLSVSVIATQDHPVSQESCAIPLQLAVHPPGTHPTPNLRARFKAWFTGSVIRRQRGN